MVLDLKIVGFRGWSNYLRGENVFLSRAAVETRSTLMTCLECPFGRQENRIVNRSEATSNVEL